MKRYLLLIISIVLVPFSSTFAGEADVIRVKVSQQSNGSFRFDVTVRHADTGWKHYADKWDVVDEAGNVLGTRVLYHPHVDEQPFTRSLGNVKIPENINKVIIRAHDSVHGYGGKTKEVILKR
ncbi:MAG: hypothetical protein MJE63_19790 [Proteobacteria bacterium]|nr:hypothetical protein [Pseudomonadota bacterium]